MLKICIVDTKHNNKDVVASKLLTYSLLKFTMYYCVKCV